MQLAVARNHQTLLLAPIHTVPRPRPIKQAREPRLPCKPRLHAHGAGQVVGDEAGSAADTVRSDGLLVEEGGGGGRRQVAELEGAAVVVAGGGRERLAGPGGAGECPAVARHPQQDLGCRHLLRDAVRHGGVAAGGGGVARREQRRVVP